MQDNRDEIRDVMISINVITGIYSLMAKKIGIKENTLTLLYALDDGKTHSQIEISREWLIPKTTLNTIVKECVATGLVELAPEEHTHEKRVFLTEAGRKAARSALNVVYALEQKAYEETLQTHSPDFSAALRTFTESLNREVLEHFS